MRGWTSSILIRATSRARQLLLLVVLLLFPVAAAAQTGTVTGTVTNSANGQPAANVVVRVVTVQNVQVQTATTDASGVYSVSNVPPGALYFVTASSASFVPEAYPDVKCLMSCTTTNLLQGATSISVAGGATVSGIDLALDPGGAISGTVTNAAGGAPLANVGVVAVVRSGANVLTAGTVGTASNGTFTIPSLPPGTYFLFTITSTGFRSEIFDNVPCLGSCQSQNAAALGTPIAVSAGATVGGRDFALEPGGTISGTVTNAATGAAAPNVIISAFTRVGTSVVFAGSAGTNGAGEYSITNLATGSYYLTSAVSSLTNEIYPDILCPLFCSSITAANSGGAVAVTLGSTTGGINFALDPGGSISGRVTSEGSGTPLQSIQVIAAIQFGTSVTTRSTITSASGDYTIPGLPAGTYALYTASNVNYSHEIFDNIPCPTGCLAATAVQVGTPVPVSSGVVTSNRDFALAARTWGAIAGTVTDSVTGLPIAGVLAEIYMVSGSSLIFAGSAVTSTTGAYSMAGLAPGSYRLATFGNHTFRNEVFDNIACLSSSCGIAAIQTGTPVAVSAGATSTAGFVLARGDSVRGRITDSATGLPIAGMGVALVQSPSGALAGSITSNANGDFFLNGVPNGTYMAYTFNSLGYRNEIFDNIPCTGSCSTATALASGTPIQVTGAAAYVEGAEVVTGINFALDALQTAPNAPTNLRIVTAGGTAQFTWTAPSLFLAAPATSYLLEAGGSPGTTFITLPVPGTGTSFSVPGVPPGTYYVRLRGVNAFGTGPASNEVLLVVGAGGTALPDAPTNLQAFMSGGLLTMTWTRALGGGPAADFLVEAGSSTGASNIATLPVPGATFSFSPVPNGVYFLRVRARNAAGVSAPSAEVMLVVGNVPAPPGAPNFNSHTVSNGTVTLNWQAPTQGTATSYIIEAGSAPGLANLATVNTGSTALTASFNAVPSGTYYVRVRAVNAQGTSVASNERTIIVP